MPCYRRILCRMRRVSRFAACFGVGMGGGLLYFVQPDHLDTPRLVVNAANQPVWSWNSAPFGDTLANEQPTASLAAFQFNLRFPGQQFDVETASHYNYFRDYEAGTGRYLQSDPVGLHAGWGSYTYVSSRPLSAFDINGLYIPPPKEPPPLPNPKPGKRKNDRKRWEFDGGFCEWDSQHGEWEIYDKRGKHQGTCSPCGKIRKPPVPGRKSPP